MYLSLSFAFCLCIIIVSCCCIWFGFFFHHFCCCISVVVGPHYLVNVERFRAPVVVVFFPHPAILLFLPSYMCLACSEICFFNDALVDCRLFVISPPSSPSRKTPTISLAALVFSSFEFSEFANLMQFINSSNCLFMARFT